MTFARGQKEHALLQSKALEWERSEQDPRRLPNMSAAAEYRLWIKQARQAQRIPAPTALQQCFVDAARSRGLRNRRILQVKKHTV